MKTEAQEKLIETIEREICGFGSTAIALREFRGATGETAIRKLTHLRSYLASLSPEALDDIAGTITLRLKKASYPQVI